MDAMKDKRGNGTKYGIATAGNLTGCQDKTIRGRKGPEDSAQDRKFLLAVTPTIIQSTWVGHSKVEDRWLLDPVCTKMLKPQLLM